MNGNYTNKQRELIDKLLHSIKQSKAKRAVRFLRQPLKTLYVRLFRAAKRSREVKAWTFWGEKIGVILPEIVSTLIFKNGYFEDDVCLYMISFLKEGMTFIDIGAHFGFFTLFGSYLVGVKGRVFAFEPIPDTYHQLQKNITNYSKYPNIDMYNCAAYSENIKVKFYDYGLEHSAFNSIFGMRGTDIPFVTNEIMVEARKIDDVLRKKGINNIDLIKIDAESSEIHVLRGITQTLMSCKPKVILEVGDFALNQVPKSKETITYLQQMGYSPYEVHNGAIVPHVIRDEYEYGNLLFINNNCSI